MLITGILLPPALHAQATGNGIEYHGGPVMNPVTNTTPSASTTVYLIWYGNWSSNSALTILPNFISSLTKTPYFALNTAYGFKPAGSSTPANISGAVTLGTQAFDSYSQGTTLTDASLQTVVSTAISSRGLPRDPNGVYFVLSSGDVNETGADGQFCVQFCGFHTHATLGGSDIKYAFVGDAFPKCINNPNSSVTCAPLNSVISPNGNPGADAMANTMAHELSETVTDPDLNAWFHNSGSGENGDLCNFNFGPTFTTPNGAQANMTLGGQNYLIQQLWLNDGGGGCNIASSGSPFTFNSARDELNACNGLAGRNSSLCSNISDPNDRQTCSAISTVSQTPCTAITDRNMQLACFGMALAPNFSSNCRDITNPQMQAFCYGASSGNTNPSPNCNNVADANSRALCLGISLHDSSQCSSISNQNDRQFCLAVSSSNSASCANIVTCPDPRGQATCTNNGNVWNTSTCTCSAPPPTCNPNLQQLCISQGGSWDPSTCTCTGGCGTQITCAQVNPIAQGQASTPLPPTELKSRFPLGIASTAPSPNEK
ncbi:MAG TPA: hypothetical protein VFB76_19030 [Candidatus Angelobacter sp.]|nr:hypothetical protein [Candidatus Angelobacter sp.]